nr:hypothetical protein [Gemmatimonadota bacterium]
NVERALDYEIRRQAGELLESRPIQHQTLLWDAARGEARPMRSKELSHDYRYFPEPDLEPLVLNALEVDEWRRSLPELPDARLRRLADSYGLPAYDAGVLTASPGLADWYESAVAAFPQGPKEVSNWVMGEVLRVLKERGIEVEAFPVRAEQLGELLRLKEAGEISGRTAKGIFEKMVESGQDPREILEAENLQQISDDTELRSLAAAVLDEHPLEVLGYLGGRQQLLSFFIGGVMKKTRGRANPQAAGPLLREQLEMRRGLAGDPPSSELEAPADPDPAVGAGTPAGVGTPAGAGTPQGADTPQGAATPAGAATPPDGESPADVRAPSDTDAPALPASRQPETGQPG